MSLREGADAVLFAVQVLYPLALVGPMHAQLIRAVQHAPDRMRAREKNAFYADLADTVLSHAAQLQYASWEYLDPTEDPVPSYWQWVEGTAQDARDEARFLHDDEARYGFVTVLVLADEGGRTHRALEHLVAVEDDEGVAEALLEHLVRLPSTFDFDSVRSDVVMVRPGAGGLGVMETMLGDARYHHLGPVL